MFELEFEKTGKINFKIIKIETITTVIKLVGWEMLIAKLDVRDACYSILILESHKNY